MARSPERLIQLARSVNDHVVGRHIGELCRELADALVQAQDDLKNFLEAEHGPQVDVQVEVHHIVMLEPGQDAPEWLKRRPVR